MPSSQSKGLLRSASPAFSLLSLSNKDGLSSKEKKYISSVEKLINTFDSSIIEWADHISFLSRLLKNLQANPKTDLTKNYIPFDLEISKCLSISLSKNLPSGVHKKALEVYDYIFQILGEHLSDSISVWLPGILPLMSYASMGVKPQLVELFGNYIIKLPNTTLRSVLRPVLLSLLPSIDDETSDNFNESLKLLEDLKTLTDDDTHFWSVMFLIIITSDDKRLGALIWCQRKLPSFNAVSESELTDEEAKNCITPSPTLLTKAISKGLIDDNILVQRGFFDLLVTHLELKSYVLQELTEEKNLRELLMNASACVLRKDMSLNRRLWNWLLGPDENEVQSTPEEVRFTRAEYFEKFGFRHFSNGLLAMINGPLANKSPAEQRIESFKISLAMMDKWEIGQLIVPVILGPILSNCQKLSDNDEVLKFANTFFDNVDCYSIWSVVLKLILDGNFELCSFILQNFNVEEEEMIVNHLPLILLALLCIEDKSNEWNNLTLSVSNLMPQRAYLPIDHADRAMVQGLDKESILATITGYYNNEDEGDAPMPFKASDMSFLILEQLSNIIIEKIKLIYDESKPNDPLIYKLCELYADVADKVPQLDGNQTYRNQELLELAFAINDHPSCLELIFGIGKIFGFLIKSHIEIIQKTVFLQDYSSQLWNLLSSDLSIRYQVEIVKLIYHLEISMPSVYVEASLTKFFKQETTMVDKLAKFNLLWAHSSNFQDSGLFLSKSVELIMDDLSSASNEPYIRNWVMILISNGQINRFIKIMISSTLLRFKFLKDPKLVKNDDFAVCNYQLGNLVKFLELDKKIAEAFKTEMIIIDNEYLIEILKINRWDDLSNYKALILEICFSLIQLDKPDSSCFIKCLQVIRILLDGNEPNFKRYFTDLLTLTAKLEDDLLKMESISSILTFLKISKSKSLPLFDESEINDENALLQLLLDSIMKASSANILIPLIKLLSESLNIFKDFIFNIILKISNVLVLKINEFFENMQAYLNGEAHLLSSDIDQSISLLVNGLEEVLSMSHSYLLAHQLDHGEAGVIGNQDPGFFGSVIQGVFQLEQHSEANPGLVSKKTAVILSFKNSVNAVYKIWLWAELNSKMGLLNGNNNNKSLIFIATRYKYRSKKFLEFAYSIEPLEILEALMSYNFADEKQNKSIFKILHVLDGARPHLTLPHLIESITSRCGPGSEEKVNNDLDSLKLSQFLFHYFKSLDKNIYEDLYGTFNNFARTILAAPPIYKQIYANVMKIIVLINTSLSNDLRKYRRELNDSFLKMLTILTNSKLIDYENDFLSSLGYSIPLLNNMDFDQDKLNLTFNTIIGYLQPFLTKNDIKNEAVERCILALNDNCATKTWRTLVTDVTINNNNFFSVKSNELMLYNSLVSRSLSNDVDKINELLAKLAANNSNFLNWNDYAEILNAKRANLKKIIYLIACSPRNKYINLINEIVMKIKELSHDKDLKGEILLLIRCLVLKFNDTYLSSIWIFTYNELFKLFGSVIEDHTKQDLGVVFSASKLLDILIYTKSEEFQLNEWLFIADNEQLNSTVSSLIDDLAKLDLTESTEGEKVTGDKMDKEENGDAVIEQTEETSSTPLLLDVKSVDNLATLQKIFFTKLSAANLHHITVDDTRLNVNLLEQDIFNDLFS